MRVTSRRTASLREQGQGQEARSSAIALRARLGGWSLGRGRSPYYQGLRVLFDARSPDGELRSLGDTGRFDWAARLASNEKLRFIASGVGIQLFPLLFTTAGEGPERDRG